LGDLFIIILEEVIEVAPCVLLADVFKHLFDDLVVKFRAPKEKFFEVRSESGKRLVLRNGDDDGGFRAVLGN